MKRIIIMAVACSLMAVGANAGAMSWSLNGAKVHAALTGSADGATTLNSGTALSGVVAYLFIGTVDAATISSQIQAGTWTTAGYVASATTTTAGTTGAQTYGNYASQSVTAYIVVFDGGAYNATGEGNYWISSAVTQTFGSTGTKTYAYTMTTATSWTHYNNVPEPTSMALLALGAAAVGLRRKFRK